MKKILISVLCTFSALSVNAKAPETVRDLVLNKESSILFKNMIKKEKLPNWVTQGGTNSASKNVEIAGNNYIVFNACKPHDCMSQRIAVMYSPTTKAMSSVFSHVNDKASAETLLWMSNGNEIKIDVKTVLLASLTGSLENHPHSFNFK